MISIDMHQLSSRLTAIDSVALISRVSSTNALARRVVDEWVENDAGIPTVALVALEQTAGRGRNSRAWHSPRECGIWSTVVRTCTLQELPWVPLAVGVTIAQFLRETFGVPAGLKWPNDIVAKKRKIAGILIESRSREEDAVLMIGAGINVLPLGEGAPPEATSISEAGTAENVDLGYAIEAWIETVDRFCATPIVGDEVIAAWRRLSVHETGGFVECILDGRTIRGTWQGIDDMGRALVRDSGELVAISAGDIITRME